jgi:hypothetical protein
MVHMDSACMVLAYWLLPYVQLRRHGVKVLTVREILAFDVEENISARVDLEDLAFSALEYQVCLSAGQGRGS